MVVKLRNRAIIGIGWLGVLRGATRAIDFAKIALLARILEQAAFGLFAVVTTIVNLLETLTQTGLTFAVIHYRLPMKNIYKTLFLINGLRGLLLSLLTAASAGLISSFYKSQELYQLLLIASVIPFLKGVQNPSTILFYQNLQLHKEFIFRIIPAVLGAITSFYFAFITRSAIGLVYGLVISTVVETILSYAIEKHYFQSKFSFVHLKKMLGYTKWLTFSGTFSYLTNQIDNLFIGRFFNLVTLGLYDLAFKLASITFTEITDLVSRVLFSSLALIKKDKKKMKQVFLQTSFILFIPASIAFIAFYLFPGSILSLAFGDKWVPAAEILQILAIYGFIRTINGPIGPLFLALGKPKVLSITDMLNLVFIIILIIPFASLWQINGVAWAIVVSYILVQPILLYNLYKFMKS